MIHIYAAHHVYEERLYDAFFFCLRRNRNLPGVAGYQQHQVHFRQPQTEAKVRQASGIPGGHPEEGLHRARRACDFR